MEASLKKETAFLKRLFPDGLCPSFFFRFHGPVKSISEGNWKRKQTTPCGK
jgi:hypothetical protein